MKDDTNMLRFFGDLSAYSITWIDDSMGGAYWVKHRATNRSLGFAENLVDARHIAKRDRDREEHFARFGW